MKNKFLLGMKQKREMFAGRVYRTRLPCTSVNFLHLKKLLGEPLEGKKPG